MKQKNDFMQKQVGTDGQQTIRREVTKHEQFIEVTDLSISEISKVAEKSDGKYGQKLQGSRVQK